MSMQDLTSDFVARINNAKRVGKSKTEVLKSNFIISLCKKLTKLNFFNGFEVLDRTIIVEINSDRFSHLIRVSKPGKRVFLSLADKYPILDGFGYNILTTSQGVLTQKEATEKKSGGELVLQAIRP